MTQKPEVRQRLTAAEAQARFLVPPGHVWDENLQQPIPVGTVMEVASLERPMDLAAALDVWSRNRATLVRFIREHLEEATYDTDGKIRRTNDYYHVPGAAAGAPNCLTKRGGERLAQLHGFGKATTSVVDKTETPEYTSATVEVTLADAKRRPIGSAVASCSTAEARFRSVFAQRKYGATVVKEQGEWRVTKPCDCRAALNDVVARAAKRAFIQAVIVATAADEIFVAAEESEQQPGNADEAVEPKPAPQAEAPPSGPRLPDVKALKQFAGKALAELTSADLARIAKTLREQTKRPAAWAPVIEAIEVELDRRTQEEENGSLPF